MSILLLALLLVFTFGFRMDDLASRSDPAFFDSALWRFSLSRGLT